MKLWLYCIAVGAVVLGCSSMETSDRSFANHPAMDLTKSRTPGQSSYLTTLGSIEKSSSGGSCATCAH